MTVTKKKLFLFFTFLFITGVIVIVALVTQPVFSFTSGTKQPTGKVDPNELRKHVAFLTDPGFARSYPRIENLNRAADYIHHQFDLTGGVVSEQTYNVDDQTFRNVIVRFGPESGERIVLGAHYDSYGGMPGADDNASGTAGLIELAKLLGKEKPAITVEVVAYTLEEPPFFRTGNMGSTVHASRLKKSGINVRAMVCLEMIGYYTNEPNSQEYPVPGMKLEYPSQGDFIAVISSMSAGNISLLRQVKKAMSITDGLPVYSLNGPASLPGVDFSDHLSYWAQGWNAVMISDTAFFRNKMYHRTGDTADRLDFEKMAKVVNQVHAALIDLVKQ